MPVPKITAKPPAFDQAARDAFRLEAKGMATSHLVRVVARPELHRYLPEQLVMMGAELDARMPARA